MTVAELVAAALYLARRAWSLATVAVIFFAETLVIGCVIKVSRASIGVAREDREKERRTAAVRALKLTMLTRVRGRGMWTRVR